MWFVWLGPRVWVGTAVCGEYLFPTRLQVQDRTWRSRTAPGGAGGINFRMWPTISYSQYHDDNRHHHAGEHEDNTLDLRITAIFAVLLAGAIFGLVPLQVKVGG